MQNTKFMDLLKFSIPSVSFYSANFPFMEGYLRSQSLKSKAAKNYLYVEEKSEELVRSRIEKGQVYDNVRILG